MQQFLQTDFSRTLPSLGRQCHFCFVLSSSKKQVFLKPGPCDGSTGSFALEVALVVCLRNCYIFFLQGVICYTGQWPSPAAPPWDHRPFHSIIGFFYYSCQHANQMTLGLKSLLSKENWQKIRSWEGLCRQWLGLIMQLSLPFLSLSHSFLPSQSKQP